ncbi:hypothetical protein EDB84DRAFT_873160 [Lactarius hengduanensis]|nr:hypothetical protein EDB84DRAFT_873160 [Lactarius hengduanensis]
MSDYSTVKSPFPSLGTTNLPEIAATDPNSYLRAEKPSGDATDSSTASSSAARTASSRTSSVEATDATTLYTSSSSSPPPPPPPSKPSSSSLIPALALVPPWSPTRIPARLRRKCPLYAEQARYQRERDDDDDVIVATAKSKSTSEEEGGALLVPETPAAGPVAGSTPPPSKAPRSGAVRRARVPPPVPVPYLIKKSRGRRVPEPAQAQERAHVCAVPGCLKSFARAEHLKRHVLSLHTYEKPFACGCGKTFARRDNLLQHQRVHAPTT